MTRFIQLCASQNNLFALDEEGHVYRSRSMSTWVKLAVTRDLQEDGAATS